jgi:SAM-dependent methyltransferase
MSVPAPTRYAWLAFNAPLAEARAESLAAALAAAAPSSVTDVGCGWGELLLRVLAHAPSARGLGVDSDETGLERARTNASARGLAGRATFRVETLPATLAPADAVICIGSDHAWGTQADALAALRELVLPGGRLLFGSGFWERRPSVDEAAALGMTPGSLPDLAGLVDLAIEAGFRPLATQTATRDEWEQFESGYLADWEEWLLRHGSDPRADGIRAQADAHRNEWLRGYRDVLGFAYLTLGRPR